MKKYLFAMLLVLAICLTIPTAAFEDHNYLYVAISDMDNERLMTQGETTLPTLSQTYQYDLRVDIVDTTEDYTLEDYAWLFYEQYEYGYGDEKAGALLMIQMEDQGGTADFVDYVIIAQGRGADILNSEESTTLYGTLDLLLAGTGLSYADAGTACADGVDTFMGMLGALLMPADGAAAQPEQPEAAEPETAEPEADEDMLILPAAPGQPEEPALSYVMDEAGLLTEAQALVLESKAQSYAEQYGCGVYVASVDSMTGNDVREAAKDYYEQKDLGIGEWKNGILFFVCMQSREYVTVTFGRNPTDLTDYGIGIWAFSDDGIAAMEGEITSYLSDGEYDKAFSTYQQICGEYLSYYVENGEGYVPEGSVFGRLIIVILVPLGIALLVGLILKSQMKTARAATEARNYIPSESFHLTEQYDQYTHTTRTVEKIEKEKSSSVDKDGFGGSSGGKF